MSGQLVPEPPRIALARVLRRHFRECLGEFALPKSRGAVDILRLQQPDEPSGLAVAARGATDCPDHVDTCPSRIRCQAATGSWTRSRQWETQRTWFRSAGATVCPPANVSGVWPSNEAWQRAAL